MTRDKHKKQFDEDIHVHHVQQVRTFQTQNGVDYESANDLDNLVTMCRPCHKKWEGIPVRPQ